MPNRKAAEKYILDNIKKLDNGMKGKLGKGKKTNYELYSGIFSKWSNKEFDLYMRRCKSGYITPYFLSNDGEVTTDVEKMFKIAESMGFNFFQHFSVKNHPIYPDYVMPIKNLAVYLNFRRTSQLLSKKISISDNTSVRDLLTGQVTGDSKSSKISLPETRILTGIGLEKTLEELLTYRGGDLGGERAMFQYAMKYGSVRLEDLVEYATGVESTKTLNAFLKSAHLDSTI